jgi:hypothetical protein
LSAPPIPDFAMAVKDARERLRLNPGDESCMPNADRHEGRRPFFGGVLQYDQVQALARTNLSF